MERGHWGWQWATALVLTALLMAGCGQSNAPQTKEAAKAPSAATASPPASGQEKIVLRFPSWQWGQPGYDAFLSAAIVEFEKTHPNVKIEKIPVASARYADDLTKMFAANDPPEIVQYLSQLFYKAAAAGWLDPLDDKIAQTDIGKTWATYLLDAGRVGGKTYGIWISGYSNSLMYNKRMLEEAKVSVPKTPEQLIAAAKKLTKKQPDGSVSQFGYSLTTKMDNNAYIYGFSSIMVGLGGGWGADAQHLNVVTPANRKAIEVERDLIKAGVVPLDADRIKARQLFYQGKAAMIIEGPWVMTSAKSENPQIVADLGVAPIPFPNQSAGPSNGFAIAKDQKHKDLAWEFIKMVTSDAWMQKFGEMAGVTPARQGALTAKAMQDYPWLSTFADNEKTGKSYLIPGLQDVEGEIDKAVVNRLHGVFFGNKSPDEALKEIKGDIEKVAKQ
ncbi:MAG: sugar ABC transporter substrate-binding protein [Burkholderiales bacterium]|nr:sugar ABC transporter substrate-binding protein [Burkholderiales bacterium]